MRRLSALIMILAVGAAGVGLAVWRWPPALAAAQDHAPTAEQGQSAAPVEIATVQPRDVPIYRSGIGAVQAFNTVTVKSRVDGELQKVAFTEGQTVQQGELLAQIDPRPFQAQLDQATAKAAQDAAQLANARRDLARFSELAARQYATQQSLDTQKALVAQLEAALKGDQAMIETAQIQLGYTTIVAPLTGRTGIRLVDQGNIVHATDAGGLVVVTQLQPISVLFTLPEDDLPAIAEAMAAGPAETAALSRDEKTELDRGVLSLVDNQIDQATGTIRLKAVFPNRDQKLWPGQFVNARVLLRVDRGVLTVPQAAIQRGPTGLFTYVVKPDDTVEIRPVEVGQMNPDLAVVTHGLTAGERVVTAGQYRLQQGTPVQVPGGPGEQKQSSAASPETAS